MNDQPAAPPAAGAVVWRGSGSRLDVLLVHRPRYDDWTFPKGKLDQDEHRLVAAVREVREETGLTVRLAGRCPPNSTTSTTGASVSFTGRQGKSTTSRLTTSGRTQR